MEEKKKIIEQTVRKCTDRLDGKINEQQIQGLVNRLVNMKSIEEVVDSLALSIDKFFSSPEQRQQYDDCMGDILHLAGESYKSKEDIIARLQENKAKNYTPRKYFC